MQFSDLLSDSGRPTADQQGGRLSLDKAAVSDAARARFSTFMEALDRHAFWTAAAKEKSYIPSCGLWAPQRRAVGLALAYYAAQSDAKTIDGAALIKMPTGTGKTGVIAVLACAVPQIERTLVITPRRALVEQMIEDLHRRLWGRFDQVYDGTTVRALREGEKDKLHSPGNNGPVWRLLPSDARRLASLDTERAVVVGTFAALEQILRPDRPAHRLTGRRPVGKDAVPVDFDQEDEDISEAARTSLVKLLRGFDLVIVDESHYEPAFVWSQCIRSLARPTLLFSATPYRNDFRYFDIDGRFAFSLSFEEATSNRLVRAVEVLDDPKTGSLAERLIGFAARAARTSHLGTKNARVIVRAETYDRLQAIQAELRAAGQKSVLIHHKVKKASATSLRYKNVTEAVKAGATEDVTFWLHQWKLLEGVDDSRFAGVAVVDPFTTSRAVIQQIGRVLRFSNRGRKERALVLGVDDSGPNLRERFRRYLGYEELFDRDPADALKKETKFFQASRAASPNVQYISGDFRDRLDLERGIITFGDIQVPRRAVVFRNTKKRSLDDLTEASVLAMGLEDRHDVTIIAPHDNGDPLNVRIIAYVQWGNSPLLTKGAIPSWNLGVMALVEVGERIFVLDTESIIIDPSLLDLEPEDASILQRLVPSAKPGVTSRVTVASAVSLDLSDTGIRSVTARMRDFSTGFFDLAQGMQAATSVRAIMRGPDKLISRYLSLRRSAVSEASGGHVPVEQYVSWIADLARMLDTASPVSPAFARFAQSQPAPSADKAAPQNILFDFVDVLGEAAESAPKDWQGDAIMELLNADRCLDVGADGSFSLATATATFDGKLTYEVMGSVRRRGRYRVEIAGLDEQLIGHKPTKGEKAKLLSSLLTRQQPFRVIVKDPTLIYAQNHFYSPLMTAKEISRDKAGGPLEAVIPSPWLGGMVSEKGTGASSVEVWAKKSVFGGIYAHFGLANRGLDDTAHVALLRSKDPDFAKRLDDFSLIVCDEGSKEICDFLAVDEIRRKVVLMHAKVNDTNLSLNSLQAVGRQAQASLAFMTSLHQMPNRTSYWETPVPIKDGQISSRAVKGAVDAAAWGLARDALCSSQYNKEIWILAGNILSRGALLAELKRNNPSAHARQMIYYIAALLTSAARANIDLKIFCSP